MSRIEKYIIILGLLLLASFTSLGQIGIGLSYGFDAYQYQANPRAQPQIGKRGLGSALFNLHIGPKLFIGTNNVGLALEGQIGIAPFAFDVNEYKGLGAFYFPVIASLNFKGLSGFQDEAHWGFGFAGGYEFARTDLYFIDDDFTALSRDLFQTTFGQVHFGVGKKATATYVYFRYGQGKDDAKNWHVGFVIDQNLTFKKKLKKRAALRNENNR